MSSVLHAHSFWQHFSRLVLALLGGYVVTHSIILALVALINPEGGSALLMGITLSFLIYSLVIVWVYATHSLKKAWWQLSWVSAIGLAIFWLAGGGI